MSGPHYNAPVERILTREEVRETIIGMRNAGTMERHAELGDQMEVHDKHLRAALERCKAVLREVINVIREQTSGSGYRFLPPSLEERAEREVRQ